MTEGGPTCQTGALSFKAIAGYKFDILGLPAVTGQTELWKQEYKKSLDPANCP